MNSSCGNYCQGGSNLNLLTASVANLNCDRKKLRRGLGMNCSLGTLSAVYRNRFHKIPIFSYLRQCDLLALSQRNALDRVIDHDLISSRPHDRPLSLPLSTTFMNMPDLVTAEGLFLSFVTVFLLSAGLGGAGMSSISMYFSSFSSPTGGFSAAISHASSKELVLSPRLLSFMCGLPFHYFWVG